MDNQSYQLTNNWFGNFARAIWTDILPQLRPQRVLEIGSYEGASTSFLIENCQNFGITELHCVDTWQGGIENHAAGIDMNAVQQRFQNNIALAKSKVSADLKTVIHQSESDLALAQLLSQHGRGFFDFIYVDGSHQACDVICDAVIAFRLLRKGGIIAFDDYLGFENLSTGRDLLRRPKRARDAFVNININKLEILRTPMYQLYVQKTAD